MVEDEKYQQALDAIEKGEVEAIEVLLRQGLDVSCVDEHGTSLLQHAAFKGRAPIVASLIRYGVDVNATKHEHQYTSLHFAALSGDEETVSLVLDAGARKEDENSVKRTAAQMAAFTGQTHIASFITSYFPLTLFTQYSSDEGDKRYIPENVARDLHKIATYHNVHPVKIVMNVKQRPSVLTHLTPVISILKQETEVCMRGDDIQELLAMRFHFLAQLLSHFEQAEDGTGDGGRDALVQKCDTIIKWLLRRRVSDGAQENLERFIRSGFKCFPVVQSNVLKQAVRELAGVQISADPVAIEVYKRALTGIMTPPPRMTCGTCDEQLARPQQCSKCKQVQYCDRACQQLHWPSHKKWCGVDLKGSR